MSKHLSTRVVAFVVATALLPTFVAPAFADDDKRHEKIEGKGKMSLDKGKGGHGIGGAHGGLPGHSGNGGVPFGGNVGAGIAAGVIGLAIGAAAINAINNANAPAPVHGCRYENQPLFDANGTQVATHRVHVCN